MEKLRKSFTKPSPETVQKLVDQINKSTLEQEESAKRHGLPPIKPTKSKNKKESIKICYWHKWEKAEGCADEDAMRCKNCNKMARLNEIGENKIQYRYIPILAFLALLAALVAAIFSGCNVANIL